jgi:CDP-diglyceride synthetase
LVFQKSFAQGLYFSKGIRAMDIQLKKRVLTAALLVALLLGVGVCATQFLWGRFAFLGLTFILIGLACGEYSRLLGNEGTKKREILGIFGTLLLAPLLSFACAGARLKYVFVDVLPNESSYFLHGELARAVGNSSAMFLLALLALSSGVLVRSRDRLEDVFLFAAPTLAALLHIGLGGAAVIELVALSKGVWVACWLLLVICVNDTAAYFAGKSFGRLAFAPALSPNKTWEGSVSGLLAGVFVGALTAPLLGFASFSLPVIVLAGFVVCFGQIGDLLKSALKRRAGKKDSGNILPGHGGILDRIDATLFSAFPLIVALLLLEFFQ